MISRMNLRLQDRLRGRFRLTENSSSMWPVIPPQNNHIFAILIGVERASDRSARCRRPAEDRFPPADTGPPSRNLSVGFVDVTADHVGDVVWLGSVCASSCSRRSLAHGLDTRAVTDS